MKLTSCALATALLLSSAAAQKPPTPPAQTIPTTQSPDTPTPRPAPDKAAAYLHYMQGHMYEELVQIYGRAEYAEKAIEEYKLALENDPSSPELTSALAELYAKTGRIRDAVLEAEEILKRDPNNIEARKLLGRIYLRSLGDMQAGAQSQSMLRLAIEQYEEIIKREPKDVENYILLGRLYRLSGDTDKAEAIFKRAVQMQPQSEDAISALAYLYIEGGQPQKAVEVLNSIPEAARTAKLYAALGFVYEQQKQYKLAVEAYRKAVAADSENLDAVRGLAQNLLNSGQTDAALEQFKVILDADPQDATTLMRISEIYRRRGQFDKALENLKKAESLVKDSQEVPYNIAIVYEQMGRYEDSAQILTQLLAKSDKADGSYTQGERSNRAVFLERLANVQKEMGRTEAAIATFRRMLETGSDENAPRAYDQMIETYRDQKQWDKATAIAKEAVEKLPNDRGLKLVYASQLADNGQDEEAIRQVRSLLKGDKTDREVYIALAQIHSRLKHWKDSEEALAQAQKLSAPDETAYSDFVLASIYERQKKYDAAEELFKKLLKDDPNNAMVLNYLGYMLADRGVRLDEALGYLKKAIQMDPQNGAYLDSMGWLYFKMAKYDQAEEYLRKAVERTQNDATIHDHLGDVYAKTGRVKLAIAHWERALTEWNRTVPAEQDSAEVAKLQKKLETAKVRLAKQGQAK